jgi:peroxiredoxin
MRNWLIPIVLAAVCAGAYLVARHHQRAMSSGTGSRPGQFAPEFSLQDLAGRTVILANYRGKVVLLNFWATWCEPCRQEIPEFVQLQSNHRDLQILGISLDDSTEPVRTFNNEFKINYPVAIGDAALATRYGGILGLPVSFIIGCDGRVSSRHIGEANIPEITGEIESLLKSPACTFR